MVDNVDKFAGTGIVRCFDTKKNVKCMYFSFEDRGQRGDERVQLGFCRLDPPTVTSVTNRDGNLIAKSVLPVVQPDLDGCGQGELAEC